MAIYKFHGDPNGQLSANQGDAGFDVDTSPNNYFVCNGTTNWIAFNTSGDPSGAWGGLIPAPTPAPPQTCGIIIPGFEGNPSFQTLTACGYDPESYISTAKLIPQAYTTSNVVKSKIGGLVRLIEACDDNQPPIGDLSGNVLDTFNQIVTNATEEINGYLSTIYPTPLAQTGTVAIIQVRAVDSGGAVTEIAVIESGNYQVAPGSAQNPAYLRYINPLTRALEIDNQFFPSENYSGNWNWQDYFCQKGTGLQLAVTYTTQNYSDESGQVAAANTISGVPTIVSGGTLYNIGDLLVLQGGSSFVPSKIRQACADLVCYALQNRRLAPDEKNNFESAAKCWRALLVEISEGEKTLDGTYKRFFSPVSMWGTRSVLFGSNSL